MRPSKNKQDFYRHVMKIKVMYMKVQTHNCSEPALEHNQV